MNGALRLNFRPLARPLASVVASLSAWSRELQRWRITSKEGARCQVVPRLPTPLREWQLSRFGGHRGRSLLVRGRDRGCSPERLSRGVVARSGNALRGTSRARLRGAERFCASCTGDATGNVFISPTLNRLRVAAAFVLVGVRTILDTAVDRLYIACR
jgi:hypothetical protein